MSAESFAERLDGIVAGLVAADRLDAARGAVARVELPTQGMSFTTAAGIARADTGAPMTPHHRFHTASVGKMFTATLVLNAADDGAFGPAGIDTPLGDLEVLPDTLVRGVHPDGPAITLRQLLSHTSGLKDVQGDDASGTADQLGRPAPDSIQRHFARSARRIVGGDEGDDFARHRWTAWDPDRPNDPMAGMLNRYLATGTGRSPVGSPGERFHYSDTAYVLLGVLLELATGRRYHDLQRSEIVEPLGLTDTYLAYHDDPSPDARAMEADVWYGDIPVLSTGLDLSLDWAGGGQVSTAADLCRFLRALLGGELHRTPTSAAAIRDWQTPLGLAPPRVGIGLGLLHVTAGRRSVIGHSGAWGVRVFHDPTSGAFVAGTVGQPDGGAWLADVFDAVDEELVER